VRRLLKRGIAAFCAKNIDFRMFTLHDMDRTDDNRRKAHLERLRKALRRV
jgi:NAD(P)H dehydrogenase (quinone)